MDYCLVLPEESSGTPSPPSAGTMDTIISILVPILVVIVLIILLPNVNVNMHMPSAILLVYIQAAFELLSGVMHISTNYKIGWSPSEGMESYLDQCAGFSDFFWGLLLLFKAHDPTMLRLNGCYCAVWFVFLGSILFKKPYYYAANASCTKVPIAVKGICGAASFIAAADFRLFAK